MRNVLLTLFLALAVVFGGARASAFEQQGGDGHSASALSVADANGHHSRSTDDPDAQGQDVAHCHVAMDALPDPRDAGARFFRAASLPVISPVMALPSLGIRPPIEPPSA